MRPAWQLPHMALRYLWLLCLGSKDGMQVHWATFSVLHPAQGAQNELRFRPSQEEAYRKPPSVATRCCEPCTLTSRAGVGEVRSPDVPGSHSSSPSHWQCSDHMADVTSEIRSKCLEPLGYVLVPPRSGCSAVLVCSKPSGTSEECFWSLSPVVACPG